MRKILYPSATDSNIFLHISGRYINYTETVRPRQPIKWDKVLKNGPSKICGGQPLKILLKQTISLQIF